MRSRIAFEMYIFVWESTTIVMNLEPEENWFATIHVLWISQSIGHSTRINQYHNTNNQTSHSIGIDRVQYNINSLLTSLFARVNLIK